MHNQQISNGITDFLNGPKWDTTALSFWFPQLITDYDQDSSEYGNGELGNGFSGLDSNAQDFFRYLFDMYASVCNLTFSEQSDADIQIGYTHATRAAHAYLPNFAGAEAGDVWFNEQIYFKDFQLGQFSGFVAMHELGHALGLEHPHEISNFNSSFDEMSMTIMSYNSTVDSQSQGYTNDLTDYAQSLMPLDKLALQARYGINYDFQSNDTTYSFNPITGALSINGDVQLDGAGDTIFRSVWDGGGDDLIDLSNFSGDMDIDLRSGGYLNFSEDQLANLSQDGDQALANIFLPINPDGTGSCLLENLNTGSGNDRIFGNQADNIINSDAGHDKVEGREGADVLLGGDGDDILRGGHGDDILHGGTGNNILVGGMGADSFVFLEEDSGETIIRDFDLEHDSLLIENTLDISEATIIYDSGNCIVTIDDITITLFNIDEGEFSFDNINQLQSDDLNLMLA